MLCSGPGGTGRSRDPGDRLQRALLGSDSYAEASLIRVRTRPRTQPAMDAKSPRQSRPSASALSGELARVSPRTSASEIRKMALARLFPERHDNPKVGRYRIEARLGSGAMGEVFLARDEVLGRAVALKKLIDSGEGEVRTLTVREARALARISHPNVVQVFEVLHLETRCYVAMEYVRGQNLRRWAKISRPWSEVLDVWIEVGRGLAAVHEAGLVHGDLKPENVLIGDDGRVRVTDFGLARMIEERAPTEVHSPIDTHRGEPSLRGGTPAYAAPEQHFGARATAASDQYAFAIAALEMLLGRYPLDVGDANLASAKSAERWAQGTARIPRGVLRILRRAASGEPQRRHPSVASLVQRLERQHSRRRGGRWRAWTAVGSSALAWIWITSAGDPPCDRSSNERVWDEGTRDEVRAAFARLESAAARQTWERLDARLTTEQHELEQQARQLCLATRDSSRPASASCLERRKHVFEQLVRGLETGEPTVLTRSLELVEGLADLRSCTRMASRQVVSTASLNARARLWSEYDEAFALHRLGRTSDAVGQMRSVVGEAARAGFEEIEIEARRRVGLWSLLRNDGPEIEAELAQCALEAEAAGVDRAALSCAAALVSANTEGVIDLQDARRWLRFAQAAAARMEGDASTRAARSATLARVRADLAFAEGRWDEGLGHLEEAIELGDVARDSASLRASDLRHLAKRLTEGGKLDEASAVHERALALFESEYGPVHPGIILVLFELAQYHIQHRNPEAAERFATRALELAEWVDESPSLRVATLRGILGNVSFRMGNLDQALERLKEGLAEALAVVGPEHHRIASFHGSLALVYTDLGRHEDALEAHRQAARVFERTLGPGHPNHAIAELNISDAASQLGRHAEATRHARRALAAFEAISPTHYGAGHAHFALGSLAMQRSEPEEAAAHHERARSIYDQRFGSDHSLTLRAEHGVVAADLDAGRTPSLRRIRALAEKLEQGDASEPWVREAWSSIARALRAGGASVHEVREAERRGDSSL